MNETVLLPTGWHVEKIDGLYDGFAVYVESILVYDASIGTPEDDVRTGLLYANVAQHIREDIDQLIAYLHVKELIV